MEVIVAARMVRIAADDKCLRETFFTPPKNRGGGVACVLGRLFLEGGRGPCQAL